MIIKDSICKKCGGKCCAGILSGMPKCKHLTPTGCVLPEGTRYPSCDVYPYILVKDQRFPNDKRLFLDVKCPYWKKFIKYRDTITDNDYGTIGLMILDSCVHIPLGIPYEVEEIE